MTGRGLSATIRIDAGGATLEGVIDSPPGDVKGRAVFCHPYPPYGGSMDNNVVHAACRAFVRAHFAAVRFNFRGVGRSGGTFDAGNDPADLAAVLGYPIDADVEGGPGAIVLGGYSYGSAVAAQTLPGRDGLAAVVLVSPPVGLFEMTGAAAPGPPMLVLAGDADPYCDLPAVERLLGGRPDTALHVVAGADHFWAGYEREIESRIAAFAESIASQSA